MKISMPMLLCSLSETANADITGELSEERVITGVRPYLPSVPMRKDKVYVIGAEEVEEIADCEGMNLIICGAEERINCGNNCFIAVNPGISREYALYLAADAIEKYNTWYEKLLSEISSAAPDIGKICSTGLEMLENPIMLFNPLHILLASAGMTESMKNTLVEKNEGAGYALTEKTYKAIIASPKHRDDTRAGRAEMINSPLGGKRVIYENISCSQQEYRLCINEENRLFTPADIQLCEILAEIISAALGIDAISENPDRKALRNLLEEMMESAPALTETGERILEACSWKAHDTYICLNIEKKEEGQRLVSNDSYICARLEELLADACAFIRDGRIVCIVSLAAGLCADDVSRRLEEFLRDNILIVGLSEEFEGIDGLSDFYSEAVIAVKMGRTKAPERLCFSFADYAVEHIIRYGCSVLPPRCCREKNIKALSKLSDSRVNYTETLRVYLENERNLLKTAEELHIHRTTLFYRLNKIREVIDADLENPEVRLRMLLSFRMPETVK